jgi:hypothetical protein
MERPYKRLIKHADFEVPVPSRESVLGFVVVVCIAALMILGLLLFVAWVKA